MNNADWMQQWLQDIALSEYADAFKGASVHDVKSLTETELKQVGLKLLERRSFLSAAAKLADIPTLSTSADCEQTDELCADQTEADNEDPMEEILIEALILEDRLRTSAEGQTLFRLAEEQHDTDWLDVAEQMQAHVLAAVGLAPSERNLALLRDAALRNPQYARYVRLNRLRRGTLSVGSDAIDVPLVRCADLARTSLLAGTADGRPLVVFAGSYT